MKCKYIIILIFTILFLFIYNIPICNTESFVSERKEGWTQYDERSDNTKELIKECADKYNNPDILNIELELNDRGLFEEQWNNPKYSFSYDINKPELRNYCGPDFAFYGWQTANIPLFEQVRDEIIQNSQDIPKHDKIGWHGNVSTSSNRSILKKIGDENPDLFDIIDINPIGYDINETIPQYMSLPELVSNYKYLIDIEGFGWSARLKYLLFSKRPLIIVDRTFVEYYHTDLIPNYHYIPVKNDLSDLVSQTEWIINNPEEAQEIANNAFEFATTNFSKDKLLDRIYEVYLNLKK